MKTILISQLILIFFGLEHSWREIFLEESYHLMRHMNMTYTEVRSLPVSYRKWYIKRLIKEFKKETKAEQDEISANAKNLKTYEKMLANKFK